MFGFGRGGESRLQERIVALEQAVDGLNTKEKLIRLEWESVFDKLNKTMGRLNARARRNNEQEASDEVAAPVLTEPLPVGTHAVLDQARRRRG